MLRKVQLRKQEGVNAPVAPSETRAVILPPKPRTPPLHDHADRLLAQTPDPPRHAAVAAPHALFPSLYQLLPRTTIASALRHTGTHSQRRRRLPAHEVVWLV